MAACEATTVHLLQCSLFISVMNSNSISRRLIAAQQLAQVLAQQLGPYHPLVRYIDNDNALLFLSHAGSQIEFDFVMAYISTHPGALNPPGGLFAIFCANTDLVRRCLRWLISQLARRTDDDDDSGDML